MYLVLSAFTSSPVFLLATTKVSVFFFIVCMLLPNIYIYIYIYMCVCVCVCVFVYLFIYLFIREEFTLVSALFTD